MERKLNFPRSKPVKLLNPIKGYAINDCNFVIQNIRWGGAHCGYFPPGGGGGTTHAIACIPSAKNIYRMEKCSKLKYQRAPKYTFRVTSEAPRPRLQKFRPPPPPSRSGAYILLSWFLTFVGPQYETCFMSPKSRLELWGGS
jgi:hypothetical protein